MKTGDWSSDVCSSDLSYLTSFLWGRPKPTIKKAFSDFETLCPDVEQDKRVASFGCCPLAFPHDMREAYPIFHLDILP